MPRIPQVRSLAQSFRRPFSKVLIALVLVAPVGLGSSGAPRARASSGSVCRLDWRQAAELRERRAAIAEYASEFGIPIELARSIQMAAREEGVTPRLAFQLVREESGFKRTAISSRGALGYTQLMPATADGLAPGISRAELFQTDTNLRLGFRYLHYLLDHYNDDLTLALTAYNRGPGIVDRLVAEGVSPENGYARKVLALGGTPSWRASVASP